MRTPILIKSGSFTLLVDTKLVPGPVQGPQLWKYTIQATEHYRSTVDAVGWNGPEPITDADRDHTRPGARIVRMWLSAAATGQPDLTVRVIPPGRIEIHANARLVEQQLPNSRFLYTHPRAGSGKYAYQVDYLAGSPHTRESLAHFAVVVDAGLPFAPKAAKLVKWFGLGLGIATVGGLLIDSIARAKKDEPHE